MDLNKEISKSFDYKRSRYDKSTVFEATYEQAELSMRRLNPKKPPTDINRNPITQRSSNTFKSDLFKPPLRTLQKFRLNYPLDHGPKDFYQVTKPDFYRKNQDSEFQPNFVPAFTYKPGWTLDSDESENTLRDKNKNPEIRAIKKPRKTENSEQLNKSYTKNCTVTDTHRQKSTDLPRKSYDLFTNTENNSNSLSKTFIPNEFSTKSEKKIGKKVNFFNSSTPEPQNYTTRISTPTKLPEKPRTKLINQDYQTPITPLSPYKGPRSMSPSTNISLNLSNLSAQDSEFTLRELCKNYQIISISAPRNNITGVNTGKASITLKASGDNLKSLKSTLMEKGFIVNSSLVNIGKTNNYKDLAHVDFLNQHVCRDNEKTPIKHHLESSQDIFGSSPGVGRFHSGKRICDKQAIVLEQWNRVRNDRKAKVTDGDWNGSMPSYMRSTESSARKCRKIE